jgi:hypothetical protein
VLTLIYDLANIMLARQKVGRYGWESEVFWDARERLRFLLEIVEDLATLFRIQEFEIPDFDWETP